MGHGDGKAAFKKCKQKESLPHLLTKINQWEFMHVVMALTEV
jgi:hypothetical protein